MPPKNPEFEGVDDTTQSSPTARMVNMFQNFVETNTRAIDPLIFSGDSPRRNETIMGAQKRERGEQEKRSCGQRKVSCCSFE